MLRRPHTTKLLTTIAVVAVVAGGAVAVTRTSAFRSTPTPQATDPPPPPVGVVAAAVKSGDVPIYLRGVGTVIAFNNVLIRSMITGPLVKISSARVSK
jgi:multidrug efflux system membrane fusion protein